MELDICERDIYVWRTLFSCSECQYASYCYKHASYGKLCTAFDPTLSNDEVVDRINNLIEQNIKEYIERYNPLQDKYLKVKIPPYKKTGITEKEDSLYKYHIRYINDILKQIRYGDIDYIYNINKLFIIAAYEPLVRVETYKDGCYYIRKINK